MTVNIIGAGMAGLLAANMLQSRHPVVFEKQAALPNNHSALLRFRSSIVGDTLGIPFRRVSMIKAPIPWRNPVADALSYSFKNNGQYRSDRSIVSGLVTEERYIAPTDLISRMAEPLAIRFNVDFLPEEYGWGEDFPPLISTLPMPVLMAKLGYNDRTTMFKSVPGVNVRARVLTADAYCSIMNPDPNDPISRVSITGDELIVELPRVKADMVDGERVAVRGAELIGIPAEWITDIRVFEQAYQKIIPIDDDARKRFLAWATDKHNIYSLGRYATWRPSLLLDDLVQDVRHINHWISSGGYAVRQHRSRTREREGGVL